jgi:hypothetical protein
LIELHLVRPIQYRTKCRFNEDPLVVQSGNQLALFVCPFWVKSRHFPKSALPPKADIVERDRHVRFVPDPD